MNSIDIQRIVESAGDFDQVDEGLTIHKVINADSVEPIKIRAYATETEAIEKESLLNKLMGIIAYPELLGRWKNVLVFRYLELEAVDRIAQKTETYYSIGRILGLLNNEDVTDVDENGLAAEFSGWLDRLAKMRLIPDWIVEDAISYYQQHNPHGLPVCIDYWDAMSHNFGWKDGNIYLLDEKHLRLSYQGVGLVKPYLLFDKADWEKVQQGYDSVSNITLFEEYIGFLEFYYLVAALYFYSLTSAAGRISLGKNPRYLDYRDRLIRTVTGSRTMID